MVYNMGMKSMFFNMLLIAGLTLGNPALAEDGPPPLTFKGSYEFDFAGVLFGKMGIEAEQSATGYAITSDVASAGIAKLFNKHSSHTTVDGSDKDFVYSSVKYASDYQTNKKRKSVKLTYKNGVVSKETLVPPDNPATRPAVAAALKKGSVDLLTLNLKLREGVWKAMHGGDQNFTVKTFDGRRLTQVNVSVADKKTLLMNEKKVPTVRVAVRRTMLAGYTKSEKADYDPDEPTLWLYYSDDERLVPVKIEMGFLFGKITGTLIKECRTGESCLLGIKE